jgi:hypothetical protein
MLDFYTSKKEVELQYFKNKPAYIDLTFMISSWIINEKTKSLAHIFHSIPFNTSVAAAMA